MISLEFLIASAIGLLVASGIYLILRARTFPVVLGLAMIGYAVNIFLFSMGRIQISSPAILTQASKVTDPFASSFSANRNCHWLCNDCFYRSIGITQSL